MGTPRIAFCSSPIASRSIDEAFAAERDAATAEGLECVVVDVEAIDRGGAPGRLLPKRDEPVEVIYRGWMMRGETYAALDRDLRARGYHLVNSPEAYEEAHYLPRGLAHVAPFTAKTVWVEGSPSPALVERAIDASRALGDGPFVVKDFVKSAKHKWAEACFAPDREALRSTLLALIEDRGDAFERGLVVREFMDLQRTGTNALGAPVHEERRLFFYRGEPLRYAGVGSDEVAFAAPIAAKFASAFLSMDLARDAASGGYRVVEVGDGGVSGVPAAISDREFYAALRNAIGHG